MSIISQEQRPYFEGGTLTPIALDFLPRGPRYTQFRLVSLRALVEVEITIRFDGPAGEYVRSFRRGAMLPGEPLDFTPPPGDPGDVGGMEVDDLLAAYHELTVMVSRSQRVMEARIADLPAEWDRLTEAGVVEATDPLQDRIEAERRQERQLERLLASQVAAPLRQTANMIGSAARQLVAAHHGERWAHLDDGDLFALYIAVRYLDVRGLEQFDAGTQEHSVYPQFAFLRDELRRALRGRDIDLDDPPPPA